MEKDKIFKNSLLKNNNFGLLIPMLVLSIFGCVMVYSASYYSANISYGNSYHFLTKQIVGVVLGFATFCVMTKLNYKKIKKISLILLILSFVLLLLVFVPGIGFSNYGATRWINLGFTTFQPSEIAKFSYIIFCANYLAKNIDKKQSIRKILPILLVGGLMCLCIILEPNMSITICVGIVMLFMIFISGANSKIFAFLGGLVAICIPTLIVIEPYRMKRLIAFLNPWENALDEGYQLVQSLYSLGAGGLFGVGLFNSRQKYLFLPFSESDFIFSIIGEEFGLFGVVCIMILYALIIFNGIKIATKCKDSFGVYLASGIVAIISAQVLVNIAVVTGSIPPTGVPLPFISAGSTSLIVFMSGVGILNSIHKQNNELCV